MKVLIIILIIPIYLTAQIQLEKPPDNLVLNNGQIGSWDENIVAESSVLVEGSIFKMWYQGYDGDKYHIGYATSPDGIKWMKADGVNPILNVGIEGSWDDNSVGWPCVLFNGTIYQMWYEGSDGSNIRIGYATSSDGVEWKKYNNPVLDIGLKESWDATAVCIPKVVKFNGEYFMYYSAYKETCARMKIGCARSEDGINWKKEDGINPVLEASYHWEHRRIFPGALIVKDDLIMMWYGGGYVDYDIKTGYATSANGFDWDKHHTYVLKPGDYGDWDNKAVSVNSVHFDGKKYMIWYDSHIFQTSGAIGYAISTVVDVEAEMSFPVKYELTQNYPNPFNPSTTLKYEIPKESYITLKVYDIIGREVATLVNEQQKAGYYEIDWNAANNSSGVYFYKIQAGDFVDTKKMLLLR